MKRDGITLEGSFTATINADLRVGAIEETVTVTGESPIVDVQSVRRQTVLDNEIISAIPSSRSYNNLIQLIPNSVNQGGAPTDVQTVPGMVVFGGFGGRSNEGRVNVDGISVGSAFNGAGVSSYIVDVGNAREIAMTTSGGLGETEGGGPSLNVLPKEGGNAIRGTFFGSGATSGMIGSNYTQELKDRGLTTPGETRKVWDFNLGIGGPIARDRVWFYVNLRDEGSERTVPGMFANANAGDPTKWTYVADTSRPAVLAASYRIIALRLTGAGDAAQQVHGVLGPAAPLRRRRRDGILRVTPAARRSSDEVFAGSTAAPTPSASATSAPETAGYRDYGNRVSQAKWTSPVSNGSCWKPGSACIISRYGGGQIPGLETENLIRVIEQCAASCANNGNIPGLNYRSLNWFSNINWNNQWNAAASLVTGSHSIKFGYQGALLIDQRKNFGNNQFINYRTNNGIPDQITLNINRFGIEQIGPQRRVLRPGAVDARPHDGAGRHPLRPRVELLPRADGRTGPLLPDRGDLSAHDGRRGLQRSVAARRRRLRRVRQRQDVGQGELRPLSRGGAERRVLHRAQPDRTAVDHHDAGVDRRQRQLRGRLRPDQLRRTGPATAVYNGGGADFCGAEREREFRDAWSSTRRSTRGSCRAGACARATGSGARRCSRKSCRASPSKWATSAGGSSTPASSTTARGRPRTTRSSASPFRSTRGCRAAGAGCWKGCTTSRRRPRTRLNDNYETLVHDLCRLGANRPTRST